MTRGGGGKLSGMTERTRSRDDDEGWSVAWVDVISTTRCTVIASWAMLAALCLVGRRFLCCIRAQPRPRSITCHRRIVLSTNHNITVVEINLPTHQTSQPIHAHTHKHPT